MFRRKLPNRQDAELDITSFMSLMIVLVPVLLMMMVFSHITVMQLKLPPLLANQSAEQLKEKELQLEVTNDAITIYYPAGAPLKQFSKQDETYPFDQVQLALKDVKNLLLEKGVDKKDITLLIAEDVDYQTLITTMETVRSYQAVVVASVVDAELFPDIALGDALVEAL
ncbi:ExbD/TolR family protein [Pseudoalteromonas spongiae]|uniref:ExbD/TolR family protein n=1 Tax=Pseudoalteromonas spongiae TaxID=298657 RepID=UPI00110B6067|nr:biopolymer transporter ExbD [Pseudoalteromonas spongiae]TMO85579.1 biopolymer transporter ExbD [Pseudoalteromonas spongiae]